MANGYEVKERQVWVGGYYRITEAVARKRSSGGREVYGGIL